MLKCRANWLDVTAKKSNPLSLLGRESLDGANSFSGMQGNAEHWNPVIRHDASTWQKWLGLSEVLRRPLRSRYNVARIPTTTKQPRRGDPSLDRRHHLDPVSQKRSMDSFL